MTIRDAVPAIGLVALAGLTRLSGLGARFFHQDESTHAWMSYQLAQGHGYHYDPVYHGPLLYHLQAVAFNVLGSGDWQARLIPALAGLLLVALLCIWLTAHLGRAAALTAGALAVVSPSLTYYSRFDSHDALIAALTVVIVTAPFEYQRAGLVWFAGACALAVATKLNAYFVIAALAIYFVAREVYGWIRGEERDILAYLRHQPGYLAIAAAVAVLLQMILAATTLAYHVRGSDGFTLRIVVDAVRSVVFGALEYWWGIHQQPRLAGPPYYYALLLVIYEPLILLGIPVALLWFMKWRRRFAVTLLALALVLLASAFLFDRGRSVGSTTSAFVGVALLLAGLWTVVSLWREGRDFLACWVFLGVAQLLLYAWANEKVPWLVVHIVLPWIIVTAAALTDIWHVADRPPRRMALAAATLLLVAFTARTSWIVNTRNRSSVVEPMVQLDYSAEAADAERRIADLVARSPRPLRIAVEPRVQWPFAWYFRDLNVDYVQQPIGDGTDADVLIVEDRPLSAALQERYTGGRLSFSRWSAWVASAAAGDLTGLFRFMVHHDRWGPEDGTFFGVWTRKTS